ncbi:MAG: FAD-dependent oxidoreductase [Atribacterota bacterium]|nr:FAD-dependent oxidoreductase [Atribacterota bacterium]
MDFDVLILGGGVAGLKTAEYLQDDFHVVVLEENTAVGGLAFQLGCKATSECLYCGVCRALSVKRKEPGFPVFSGRRVREIQNKGETFFLTTDREVLEGKFLVIATGASPYDARGLPNLGWKKFSNVYTGFEIETNLNHGALQRFAHFEKIAFVQCAGSRNFKEKRGYCSQVCCRYALRLSENLLFLYPQLEVDFYYMDLQIVGNKTEKLWETTQKIRLVRKIPFEAKEKNGKVFLILEDNWSESSRGYDAVILSVGMVPSPGTRQIGEMLRLNFTPEGFIKDYGEGVTSQEKVFVCGTACGPKDIEASLYSAWQVSQRIRQEMRRAKS